MEFYSRKLYTLVGKLNLKSWICQIKELRKNKCVRFKDTIGYNEFYLVKGGKGFEADTSEEDFDVTEEASNAQIRTAFKKFSKNKKLNKVLMTSFGKAVAWNIN